MIYIHGADRLDKFMCGISGVHSSTHPPNSTVLERMNDCVVHRGPDESGYFREGPIGLAHRRLSIIGVNSGQQPIFNEDESVVTIFNGEIYNYTSLRESLEKQGHQFSTQTDTEVLVHLYEEFGESLVDHLEGMFAFALWDRDKKTLLLARDPMGIKPLLIADDGNRIAFASEIQPLLKSSVNPGGINQTALSEYFSLGYIPAPKTAFKNIRSLRPGEIVVFGENECKNQIFKQASIESQDVSLDTAADELRQRMTNAVEKRLMSDVPLGTFLSGGIDSTIVTGLMSEVSDDTIDTFSVRFDEGFFDESTFARTAADFHDTNHHEFTVSPDTVRKAIPEVVSKLGQPFGDPSLIPTYVVANKASDEVTVSLSGDGADELFGGYNRHMGEYYSKYYRKIPQKMRTEVIKPIAEYLPASRSTEVGELIRKGQRFVATDADEVAKRHFQLIRVSGDSVNSAYTACNPERDGIFVLREAHSDANQMLPIDRQNSLNQILVVDTHLGLPNQMLHKVDTASMLNSLEVRVPFLDQAVVNYALGLPTEYKITRKSRKKILKKAFDDLLPDPILNRQKRGFGMPIGEWFKDELASEFEEAVAGLDTELLNSQRILDIHQEHITGSRDHDWFLWNVFVFANWHKRMRKEELLN